MNEINNSADEKESKCNDIYETRAPFSDIKAVQTKDASYQAQDESCAAVLVACGCYKL